MTFSRKARQARRTAAALSLAAGLLAEVGCAPPAIASPTTPGATPPGESPAPPPPPRPPPSPRVLRASVSLQQDFGLVYGHDVCGQEAQLHQGFACFRGNGTQYHGTPLTDSGGDPAGVQTATTRLLLGLDVLLLRRWTLGVRGGWVLRGGGPRPDGAAAPAFLPFHGELRAAHWLGDDPFARTGLRFGLFVSGGTAQVDATWRVRVQEDTSRPPPAAQPNNPPVQTLDAYRKSGTAFLAGGLTSAWPVGDRAAFFLEVKVMWLLPSTGAALAPILGYEHAF